MSYVLGLSHFPLLSFNCGPKSIKKNNGCGLTHGGGGWGGGISGRQGNWGNSQETFSAFAIAAGFSCGRQARSSAARAESPYNVRDAGTILGVC